MYRVLWELKFRVLKIVDMFSNCTQKLLVTSYTGRPVDTANWRLQHLHSHVYGLCASVNSLQQLSLAGSR